MLWAIYGKMQKGGQHAPVSPTSRDKSACVYKDLYKMFHYCYRLYSMYMYAYNYTQLETFENVGMNRNTLLYTNYARTLYIEIYFDYTHEHY